MKIVLNEVTKSYLCGDGHTLTIIDNLTAELPTNCSISIRGPSGVGKSTLLHVLAGLEEINSGSILCGDYNLAELNADQLASFRRQMVGLVFQFHHLLPEFSARENIAMPLLIAGVPEDEAMARADMMLDKVGLKNRSEHRPAMMSGGEQQRVAVGRALIAKPLLVLADEPTGNLDPETGRQIGELLKSLQKEQGYTLIVVTHSIDLADSLDVHFTMEKGGKLTQH